MTPNGHSEAPDLDAAEARLALARRDYRASEASFADARSNGISDGEMDHWIRVLGGYRAAYQQAARALRDLEAT